MAILLFYLPVFAQDYKYSHVGNDQPTKNNFVFGIAMLGGGSDLDEAFRWLCAKSGGGDILVLRAEGGDDYNAYINGICKVNSVSTLMIPDRASAQDRKVAALIRRAQAIFIAGGDQGRYVNFWKGTPVEDALNANIVQGKPIGGTSAGLAVLGEFVYGALADKATDNDLTSAEVLNDPYFYRITLVHHFLKLSLLKNTLTDTHFAKRDRLGRSLGFLARIAQDGWSTHPREIAVDEKSAVLVGADGSARIVGSGKGAYFLEATEKPKLCSQGKPLTIRGIRTYHAPTGAIFDVKSWSGTAGESYTLSVVNGIIRSSGVAAY